MGGEAALVHRAQLIAEAIGLSDLFRDLSLRVPAHSGLLDVAAALGRALLALELPLVADAVERATSELAFARAALEGVQRELTDEPLDE